jgi:hypothetical protein
VLYQHLLQTADADAVPLLNRLTLVSDGSFQETKTIDRGLTVDTIAAVAARHSEAPHERQAQRLLAEEVRTFIYSPFTYR